MVICEYWVINGYYRCLEPRWSSVSIGLLMGITGVLSLGGHL